jgi:hypothetical protein
MTRILPRWSKRPKGMGPNFPRIQLRHQTAAGPPARRVSPGRETSLAVSTFSAVVSFYPLGAHIT